MTKFRLDFPLDGDILHRHDGEETSDALAIVVRGVAPVNDTVTVNGIDARRQGDAFECEAQLTARHNTITIATGAEPQAIEVSWNRGSRKRYRFSMDDNILFLKDLGSNSGQYPSLFDHWYLGFLRDMHARFGTKVHINIYYQTDGFDLTQMPDRWRDEWEANASWLHLSFHALQDKPDRPYRNASYTQMAHDFDLVTDHIRRFAGDAVLGSTTTIHWAECPAEGVRALRDRGIETLVGLFDLRAGGCTTGYYLTPEQQAHCNARTAWRDTAMGVTFVHCPCVVNAFEAEAIPAVLDARAQSPQTGEMIELLIHEQYFRRELDLYQPTVMQKVEASLEWVTNNGYDPVFWSDGFLGTSES
ncbi:MAG: hypothetical protein GY851_30530 [bacterium]|nr:hypothetical protein [bacterium]